MTRIQLVSDLHLEMMQPLSAQYLMESLRAAVNTDIIILAGDICNSKNMREVLQWFCDHYRDTIFICGNHEYYGSSFDEIHEQLSALKLSNLHWLSVGSIPTAVIKGQRFVGSTLWYPPNPTALKLIKHWLDCHCIKNFTPEVWNLNELTVNWLIQNIQEGDIVVTHMSPSYRSVGKQYTDDPYNCFFANELDAVIRAKKPSYWFHGHHHDPSDYMIGDTRIIANPRGYSWKGEGKEFKTDLIIEI